MAMLTCSRCGTVSGPDVRFCGRCGTPLPVATSAPPASTPAAPPTVDPLSAAGSALCPGCGTANAATARFCGRCGTPLLAAALTATPAAPAAQAFIPTPPAAPAVPAAPAFVPATPAQVSQAAPRKAGRRIPWAVLIAIIGVTAAVLAVAAQAVTQHAAPPCGAACPPPPPPRTAPPLGPAGPPLPPLHRYTSSAAGYSLEYPDSLPSPAVNDAQKIGWSGTLNDGNSIQIVFSGEPANGRSPQQIVQSMAQSQLGGNATQVFVLPDAALGYALGYGAVYDVLASPQGGQQQDSRYIVEASVVNGTAVELLAESPLVPDKNEHPAPAQLEPFVEGNADSIGNTVTWPGEAPL